LFRFLVNFVIVLICVEYKKIVPARGASNCLIPVQSSVFVKIIARLVYLYRPYSHFTAFSRIYSFLPSPSSHFHIPLNKNATCNCYLVFYIAGSKGRVSLYYRDYAGFLLVFGIAKTKLGFSILPGLGRVSLYYRD